MQNNKLIQIVKEAGKILTKYYFENKKNKLLIDVDQKINEFIVSNLQLNYPDYQIVSEESQDNQPIHKENAWIVDPIDGSFNFYIGQPNFCIAIALLYKGKPSVGIVYAPLKKMLFYSDTKTESYLLKNQEWKRLSVSNSQILTNSSAVLSPLYKTDFRSKKYKNIFKQVNYIGSVSLRICLTACGLYDATITEDQNLSIWDICAAYCILRGAKGSINDFAGKKFFSDAVNSKCCYNNFIAANNTLIKLFLKNYDFKKHA